MAGPDAATPRAPETRAAAAAAERLTALEAAQASTGDQVLALREELQQQRQELQDLQPLMQQLQQALTRLPPAQPTDAAPAPPGDAAPAPPGDASPARAAAAPAASTPAPLTALTSVPDAPQGTVRGYDQRTEVHDRAAQIADAFLAHAGANLQPAEQSVLRSQISAGLARLHLNEVPTAAPVDFHKRGDDDFLPPPFTPDGSDDQARRVAMFIVLANRYASYMRTRWAGHGPGGGVPEQALIQRLSSRLQGSAATW